MIRCHEAVCFSLYLGLLVYFVLSLDTDYIKSYALLAWSHMTLFLFGFPGHLMNITLMEGMIWYVLPMTLITLNDIAAYYVGFFFGKTPLIKVNRICHLLWPETDTITCDVRIQKALLDFIRLPRLSEHLSLERRAVHMEGGGRGFKEKEPLCPVYEGRERDPH